MSQPEIGPDQLKDRLTEAVRRVCPWWLRSQADDLVATAIARVVAAQERREGNWRASSSYLQRAAFSAVVDEIRHRRRSREVQAPEGFEPAMVIDDRVDPERSAGSWEIRRGLRECLAALAEDRRLACVVRLQGHSVPEGARILGWSEKRTENLVYRGLAELRRCLESSRCVPLTWAKKSARVSTSISRSNSCFAQTSRVFKTLEVSPSAPPRARCDNLVQRLCSRSARAVFVRGCVRIFWGG